MALQAVLDRVAATSVLLGNVADLDCHAATSKSQRECIEAMLTGQPLDVIGLAKVSEAVKHAKFKAEDSAGLLCTIAKLAASPGCTPTAMSKGGGSKYQNYETLPYLLPEKVWATLGTESGADDLFMFVTNLIGLREPSEHTCATLALLLLCASEGSEKACNASLDIMNKCEDGEAVA